MLFLELEPTCVGVVTMISCDEGHDMPWIRQRLNKNTQPTHVILSRQIRQDTESTLTLHTAGQFFLWEISLKEVAIHHGLLEGMAEGDRQLVQWLLDNDIG